VVVRSSQPIWLTIGILLILEFWVIKLCSGPASKPETAPDDEFSASRARGVHERIFPAAQPHPVGSLANQVVRERLVTILEELGLEVEIQLASHAIPKSDERVSLENVLAHLPGPAASPTSLTPLLLVSHYDSCPVGPGASDAGACVAALIETARALRNSPELKRPTYFLFTDGEERGLWGADEFVNHHPLAKRKPFVVNFDARGSAGASLMFETQIGNRNVINAVVPDLGWPRLTNSLFVTVYRQLPNGTDFTIFRNAGCPGINFACVDGAHVYHRPIDTLDNVSVRTLQHHGEHALGMAKAIGMMDHEFVSTNENAIFFDLLGTWVISYPESLAVYLQLAAFGVCVLTNWRSGRLRRRLGGIAIASVLILGFILAAAMGGFLTRMALVVTGVIEHNLSARMRMITTIYWLVTIGIFGLWCRVFVRRISDESWWNATWLGWGGTGVMLTILLPEVSFVCLIPTIAAALASSTRWSAAWRTAVMAICTGVILLPMLHLFPIAMGAKAAVVVCAAFSLMCLTLFPMFGRTSEQSLAPARADSSE